MSVGKVVSEFEVLEPEVEEELPVVAARLGAAEAKEVLTEVRAVEKEVDALEAAAGELGGETRALDAKAGTVETRVQQLSQLMALAGGDKQ